MSGVDWHDSSRIDRIEFEMVDPNDINASRGWLDGVVRSGSSLTYAYYSDTRVSGVLKIVDANYIDNSLIRIHHYVDAWGYHGELGTFFVDDEDAQYSHGVWSGTLGLSSRLVALSEDHWVRHFAIAQGKDTKTVLASIMEEEGLAYSIDPGCSSTTYTSAMVYEFGESVITTAFEVSNKMSARLDVDGHGVIVARPYNAPSARTPVWEMGQDMVVGAITKTTNVYDMPGRVGVIHSMSEDEEITAYADVPTSSPAARSRRGRRITEIVQLPDMSPETSQMAGQEARKRLDNATELSVEYDFDALYQPYLPGDVGWFDLAGERKLCMLKTLELSLSYGLKTQVTLKEVA